MALCAACQAAHRARSCAGSTNQVQLPRDFKRVVSCAYASERKCIIFVPWPQYKWAEGRVSASQAPVSTPEQACAISRKPVSEFRMKRIGIERREIFRCAQKDRRGGRFPGVLPQKYLTIQPPIHPVSQRCLRSPTWPGRLRSGALRAGRLDGRIQATYFRDRTLVSCPKNTSPFSRRFIPSRSVAFARRPGQVACALAPCEPGDSAAEFRQLISGTEH